MNVSTFAAFTVVLLVFYVGARYCTKLIRKEISPRIATWLIFEIGVVMSLASYLSGNDHSLIKAALNAADSLQVTVILITLVIEQRGQKIHFTRNELVSLGISCVAAVALDGYQDRLDRLHRISVGHVCRLPTDHRKPLALEVRAVARADGKVGC